MFGVIMPLWNRMFCCILYWNQAEIWKKYLLSSSRAISLSTPTFSLSTPVDSEATWKKATKCNKYIYCTKKYCSAWTWSSITLSTIITSAVKLCPVGISTTQLKYSPGCLTSGHIISTGSESVKVIFHETHFFFFPEWTQN